MKNTIALVTFFCNNAKFSIAPLHCPMFCFQSTAPTHTHTKNRITCDLNFEQPVLRHAAPRCPPRHCEGRSLIANLYAHARYTCEYVALVLVSVQQALSTTSRTLCLPVVWRNVAPARQQLALIVSGRREITSACTFLQTHAKKRTPILDVMLCWNARSPRAQASD